ncbi:hypothetical protein AB1Y20_010565 [Prymnesium parvum]|uniref:Dynein regulatory complex protein 10 n=1 Tax=Prymnesium parvum TaxID=97485 RepID=A0AB34IP22_PRYPA|mmetsp:Transcript_21434/g.53485  ORF Transcript_21434/g.53485 Transcript_21434/m.53485 type:complete len:397 (+) Transcript_21434:64-1254(+)
MASLQSVQKLTNVEAQRIMAILEETYHKLELLSHVPPLQIPNVENLRRTIGPEVLQVLEEQSMLEQQYKWVSAPLHEQKSGYEGETLPDFETLDDELRHSTRVVCRILREAPAIVDRLEEQGADEASMAIQKFLHTLSELKEQTFQKLSTSVEEEKSKEDWFLEISAREEKASQTLRQLQKEIKLEKADRERQVSARNETIQKLRDELEEIRTSTINETKRLQADTKAQEEADLAAFKSKEASLNEELARLEAELAQKKQENRESEEQLRKKKMKNESEVEAWISKYDQDMEEKHREISTLRGIYEEERKELLYYEDYFNKLLAEREATLAEERKKAEELARQKAQQATLEKAATMLQKVWRGKVTRRDLERKKAGSRGKKKGGKGAKGAKGKKKK